MTHRQISYTVAPPHEQSMELAVCVLRCMSLGGRRGYHVRLLVGLWLQTLPGKKRETGVLTNVRWCCRRYSNLWCCALWGMIPESWWQREEYTRTGGGIEAAAAGTCKQDFLKASLVAMTVQRQGKRHTHTRTGTQHHLNRVTEAKHGSDPCLRPQCGCFPWLKCDCFLKRAPITAQTNKHVSSSCVCGLNKQIDLCSLLGIWSEGTAQKQDALCSESYSFNSLCPSCYTRKKSAEIPHVIFKWM